ncbi:hypothetical protein [Lysobacter tyrosinilyticus]
MKILLGLLLAMLSCASCATTAGHVVDISGLSATYDRTQPVQLTLKNVSHVKVRAYANLEVMDESGQWVTWPFRVEDGTPGAVSKIYPLNPSGATTLVFDIQKIELPPIPAGQKPKLAEQLKFRFRVVVLHATSEDRTGEFFSEAFVIRKPYG